MDGTQVWIVDDDSAVRNSLRLLLRSAHINSRIFAAPAELLAVEDYSACVCLVLDIRLPQMTGLDLHQELLKKGVQAPAIFITGHGDIPMAVKAMQQGGFDFITKPFRDSALLSRVQAAMSTARQQQDRDQRKAAIHRAVNSLTQREVDVAKGLSRGLSNKQVGVELDISPRTVETHRAKIMEKMGVESIAALVRSLAVAGYLD